MSPDPSSATSNRCRRLALLWRRAQERRLERLPCPSAWAANCRPARLLRLPCRTGSPADSAQRLASRPAGRGKPPTVTPGAAGSHCPGPGGASGREAAGVASPPAGGKPPTVSPVAPAPRTPPTGVPATPSGGKLPGVVTPPAGGKAACRHAHCSRAREGIAGSPAARRHRPDDAKHDAETAPKPPGPALTPAPAQMQNLAPKPDVNPPSIAPVAPPPSAGHPPAPPPVVHAPPQPPVVHAPPPPPPVVHAPPPPPPVVHAPPPPPPSSTRRRRHRRSFHAPRRRHPVVHAPPPPPPVVRAPPAAAHAPPAENPACRRARSRKSRGAHSAIGRGKPKARLGGGAEGP